MTTNLNAAARKNQILDAAVALAVTRGYENITRTDVATAAGVSTGLVNKYFATIPQLKRSVMRAAVHRRILPIVAQGLTSRDPQAEHAPDELKQAAVASILA